MASAISNNKSLPGGAPSVQLYEKINRDNVVPTQELRVPHYCFQLDNVDFSLKKNDKDKAKAAKCQELICMTGLILSALMNTCGGLLALLGLHHITGDIIDQWRNNLNAQMQHIPRAIFKLCLSMPIVNHRDVLMFVKTSPKTITYNTHMYVRGPAGSSDLADSDTAVSVIKRHSQTSSSDANVEIFSKVTNLTYKQKLPRESQHLEYKYWNVKDLRDLWKKLKEPRSSKGMFSLANNPMRGYFVIGVDDATCEVRGQFLSESDKADFKAHLAAWMGHDDDGVQRVWGKVSHVPTEGREWEASFLPVLGHPDGTDHYVIVIIMKHCRGGMFVRMPECYEVDDEGNIVSLTIDDWKQRILKETQGIRATSSNGQLAPLSPGIPRVPSAKSLAHFQFTAPFDETTTSAIKDTNQNHGRSSSADISRGTQKYRQASWTKCGDFRKYVTEVAHIVTESKLVDPERRTLVMRSPLHLVPDLLLEYPHDLDQTDVDLLLGEYSDNTGVAITFRSWAKSFHHCATMDEPSGHLFDTLVLYEDTTLRLRGCFKDEINRSNIAVRTNYIIQLTRVLRKHLSVQMKTMNTHSAINIPIEAYIYTTADRKLHKLLSPGKPLEEHYVGQNSHLEGSCTDGVQTTLIKLTVERVVWLKNRVNKMVTHTLTQDQTEATLRVADNNIVILEAPPGCGKSVVAAYICQRYGGPQRRSRVLYICPRKGFATFVQQQGNSEVGIASDDVGMACVIQRIRAGNYAVIVVDDIQAMVCSQSAWTELLYAIHGRCRLILLKDSKYQTLYNIDSCSALNDSIKSFCEIKKVPEPFSYQMTKNMRNTQKVHGFLMAQIENQDGTSEFREFTIGHSVLGDDVNLRVITHPLEDSSDNGLIQLVQDLIQCKGDHQYGLSDIAILLADSDSETADRVHEIFRKHSNFATHSVCQLPHTGVVVDVLDEFVGMESTVCVVVFLRGKESLNKMQYRIFSASRGISRVELVFTEDFSSDLARSMAIDNLNAAEKSVELHQLWQQKVGDYVSDVSFLEFSGTTHLVYVASNLTGPRQIGALNLAGDDRTGLLPSQLTDIRYPWKVRCSCDGKWLAVVQITDRRVRELTTVRLAESGWQHHNTFRLAGMPESIAVTTDGEVVSNYSDCLMLYSQSGDEVWRRTDITDCRGIALSQEGNIYVADENHNRILIYTIAGVRLQVIHVLSHPLDVSITCSGHHLLVTHGDDGISIVSSECQIKRRVWRGTATNIATCREEYLAIEEFGSGTIRLIDFSEALQG